MHAMKGNLSELVKWTRLALTLLLALRFFLKKVRMENVKWTVLRRREPRCLSGQCKTGDRWFQTNLCLNNYTETYLILDGAVKPSVYNRTNVEWLGFKSRFLSNDKRV